MADNYGRRVRELLPEKFDRLDAVIHKEMERDQAKGNRGVPGFVWDIVGTKAALAVRGTLDCDVFELLARGWCVAREFHAYTTDPEKTDPAKEWSVFLGEHEVKTNVHPVLTVEIPTWVPPRVPLRFTLELTARFDSAEILIRNKHIIGIGAGTCSVAAQLKYRDQDLHTPLESRDVTLTPPLKLRPPGLLID
jgi:hypothetical protein